MCPRETYIRLVVTDGRERNVSIRELNSRGIAHIKRLFESDDVKVRLAVSASTRVANTTDYTR